MKKQRIDYTDYANTITKALKKGIFLTTKAGEKVNSMVIGWGHVGQVWNLPVFVAYVRDSRYTRELLDQNPEFTINVPIGDVDKKAFSICGSKSGRDMDKINEAGLTLVPPEVISVPGIKEFPLTLECKVLYRQEENVSVLPEVIQKKFYGIETGAHIIYFGQIVADYLIED